MAPRKPKDDDASSTTSDPVPPVLKPKTEKAKVAKGKTDKAKSEKPKTEKAKPVKKEGVKKDGEKAVKKDVDIKTGGAKAGDGGKVKEKPVTGEEAMELMARYLRETNRPYSATEVSANLHNKVPPVLSQSLVHLHCMEMVEGMC